jgi:hypothetical protein
LQLTLFHPFRPPVKGFSSSNRLPWNSYKGNSRAKIKEWRELEKIIEIADQSAFTDEPKLPAGLG